MQRASITPALHKKEIVIELLILVAITLAALLLRFYKLGQWSFWGDEIFTLSLREDGFNYSPWRKSLASLLIQWVVANFGANEWNARLVPAAIGVISIPALHIPARKLFGTKASLTAAVLLAVSTWHIYWSQNARFYILLLLFYSLALLTFHIGMEEDRPGILVLSLLFLGLAARERLLALFLLPVVITYLALLKLLRFPAPPGLRWRNLVLYFGPMVILAILFAGPYVRNLGQWMSGFGTANNSPFWLLAGIIYYTGIPTICIGAFTALALLLQKNRSVLLICLSACLPTLILMGIAPFHYTANRYVFISLTSWILLASLAAQELLQKTAGNTRILAAGLLAVLVIASLSDDLLYFRYQNGNRENWKAAYAYIQLHKEPGDLVVNSKPDLGAYYLGEKTSGYASFRPPEAGKTQHRIWLLVDMDTAWLFPKPYAWLASYASEQANFDVHVYARNFMMRVYMYDPQGRYK